MRGLRKRVYRAEARVRVDAEQVAQQLDRRVGDAVGVLDLGGEDVLERLDLLGAREWREAGEQLEEEDAERPPVDRAAVPLARDDLGREVVGRAAQRPRAFVDDLGEAEVGDLEVPSSVQTAPRS